MSLDVYLTVDQPIKAGSGIFIREHGQTIEITREEWDARFPNIEPVVIERDTTDYAFEANITHNLAAMARAAGLYDVLWRPEENGITTAAELIQSLRDGLCRLVCDPVHYRTFNPPNGWGNYEGLVSFVIKYLEACMEYPDAKVSAWR